MATVRADQELCCAAAQCVFVAPAVFAQDEDGLVVVIDDAPTGEALKQAVEAQRDCPTRAITVEG